MSREMTERGMRVRAAKTDRPNGSAASKHEGSADSMATEPRFTLNGSLIRVGLALALARAVLRRAVVVVLAVGDAVPVIIWSVGVAHAVAIIADTVAVDVYVVVADAGLVLLAITLLTCGECERCQPNHKQGHQKNTQVTMHTAAFLSTQQEHTLPSAWRLRFAPGTNYKTMASAMESGRRRATHLHSLAPEHQHAYLLNVAGLLFLRSSFGRPSVTGLKPSSTGTIRCRKHINVCEPADVSAFRRAAGDSAPGQPAALDCAWTTRDSAPPAELRAGGCESGCR